jgi:O-antigen/teichoic acid export membrane protein
LGVPLVRFYQGDSAAGVFAIPTQVALTYQLVSAVVLRILQPHIAGPYGFTVSFLKKLILFSVLFHVLLYLAGAMSATCLILFVLPVGYQGALGSLFVLLAASFFLALAGVNGSYLMLLRQERVGLAINVASAIFYLLLGWILVPALSGLGAALAALLAYALLMTCGLVVTWFAHPARATVRTQNVQD